MKHMGPFSIQNYSSLNDEEVLISTAYNNLLHYGREVNGNFDLLPLDDQSSIIKEAYAESDSKVSSYSITTNDIIRADMYAYLAVMRDIQRRMEIVVRLINQEIGLMYPLIRLEFITLQIRMIIESIALASLSANKSLFEEEGNKFRKRYKANQNFKSIEKKNPDFYPKPIEEDPSGIPFNIIYIEDGFMTRDEIIKVYVHCGNFLHAKNPYGKKRDYEGFITRVPNWMNKINRLLNNHLIKLLDDEGEYIVTMQDPTMYNTPNMCYRLTVSPDTEIQNAEPTTESHLT